MGGGAVPLDARRLSVVGLESLVARGRGRARATASRASAVRVWQLIGRTGAETVGAGRRVSKGWRSGTKNVWLAWAEGDNE